MDRSVYHYLNCLGLANLCSALEDDDTDMYQEIAAEIKSDILGKMWDKETNFFYDLHYKTDEKAMVKNLVGIYPYWAEITEEEHLPGLEYLFDPDYFGTETPFPTTARDCPAYRPEGGWMGNFVKGRDGCVWAGASWPYTTGIALDAIAKQSKRNSHKYDEKFGELLRKYSLTHFKGNDISQPYLVEHYNPETGEPLSDEADYNHSYYLELILAHVAGVTLTGEGVDFDPITIGLDYFVVDNVTIRGDQYKITYRQKECSDPKAEGLLIGYHVYKNGRAFIERSALAKG